MRVSTFRTRVAPAPPTYVPSLPSRLGRLGLRPRGVAIKVVAFRPTEPDLLSGAERNSAELAEFRRDGTAFPPKTEHFLGVAPTTARAR